MGMGWRSSPRVGELVERGGAEVTLSATGGWGWWQSSAPGPCVSRVPCAHARAFTSPEWPNRSGPARFLRREGRQQVPPGAAAVQG